MEEIKKHVNTKNIDYSDEWKVILEKEDELHSLKNKYILSNTEQVVRDIKRSLANYYELPLVLNFLKPLDEKFKTPVIDELFQLAFNGNPNSVSVAMDILLNMDRNNVIKSISAAIEKVLSIEIEEDYEDYVRLNIVSLLIKLGLKDTLCWFLKKHCLNSSNEDVREIYDNYAHHCVE